MLKDLESVIHIPYVICVFLSVALTEFWNFPEKPNHKNMWTSSLENGQVGGENRQSKYKIYIKILVLILLLLQMLKERQFLLIEIGLLKENWKILRCILELLGLIGYNTTQQFGP